MKKRIGFVIAYIGAILWEKGGYWNERNKYEELTILGKLGYNLFRKGLTLVGITKADIERICNMYQQERRL